MVILCNCPACGSRNTKSLKIIYESGQRTGRSRRRSVYGSFSGSLWAGFSTTESHSSSLIAAHAAPSASVVPFSWSSIGVPLFIGVIFFDWPGWIIPVVMFSLAILYGISDIYAQRLNTMNDWHKKFQCLRCGTVFIPMKSSIN